MRISMTNYLDVISSWCYWAMPAWQELQQRYRDSVGFRWKIALMDKAGSRRLGNTRNGFTGAAGC